MSGVDEKARLEEDNRVLGTELEDFQSMYAF